MQAIVRDITEQKSAQEALRQSEERYRTILEDILEGCYETDIQGNLTFFNNSFCKIIGYPAQELYNSSYINRFNKDHLEYLKNIFNEVYLSGLPNRRIECVITTKDGFTKNVEISVSPIRDVRGKSIGFRGIMRDITERKKIEDMFTHMAFHDPLTGLPNRRLFEDRLYVALKFTKRNNKKLALILMDMDNFKEVNDTLGHQTGDKLLNAVCTRINGLIRKSDTLARMGGDEFTLLLPPEINNQEDIIIVADKITRAFRQPFICEGTEIFTSASIGIAIYPDHGDDADTLISHADIAMYQAKKSGGNCFRIY